MDDKRKEAPVSETLPKELDDLKKAAEPLYKLLTEQYDPMCFVVVDWDGVKVGRAEYGVPLLP